MSKKKSSNQQKTLYRDAKTGRFVTPETVKRRPSTTVTEKR